MKVKMKKIISILLLMVCISGSVFSLDTIAAVKTSKLENVQMEKGKKITFRRNDKKKVERVAKKYDLPKEVVDGLKKSLSNINEKKEVILVVPKEEIKVFNVLTSSTKTEYYTKKYKNRNYKMKDYYITDKSIWTKSTTVYSGKNTKANMKALSDFSVFALQNTLLRTHPITSAGISLLQIIYGSDTSFTGSKSDYVEARVNYDYTSRYTYVHDGGEYVLGAFTSSGKLIKIEWSTYIKNAGTVKHKTTSYNNTYKSANYDNAAVKAITSLNPWSDDGIGIKIGSKWFYFS